MVYFPLTPHPKLLFFRRFIDALPLPIPPGRFGPPRPPEGHMCIRPIVSRATLVGLVCFFAVTATRAAEPKKLVQKVYAVADLVIPIPDFDAPMPATVPASKCATQTALACEVHPCCVLEFAGEFDLKCGPQACEQCKAAAPACCTKAAMKCCDAETPCCKEAKCCDKAPACCPNGACCPDGACCPKTKCCEKTETKKTLQDRLITLVMNTVSPNCWTANGGACTIEYFPIGMALVVNAPADVQEQVANLVESLRRLQDNEVAFEVKFVSVDDARFVELFAKEAATKFDGGMPMFLNGQQAMDLWKSMQGDPHSHVLQAPKVTVFNGQKASVCCMEQKFFVTSMDPVKFNGQTVYTPKNEPFNIGFQMTVRPTISDDRKFVRCELKAEHSELAKANVQMVPFTTPITPIFEGGAQGQPVPFTQFIQQPSVVRRCVEKSLAIPDGGTAVLYAGKRERVEESADDDAECSPIFEWIYDLVDLFGPPTPETTITEHMVVLVTPRILVREQCEAVAKPMPCGPLQPGQFDPRPFYTGIGCPAGPCADLDLPIRQCVAETAPMPRMEPMPITPPVWTAQPHCPTAAAPCCSGRTCPVAEVCPMPKCDPTPVTPPTWTAQPHCPVPCIPPAAMAQGVPAAQVQLDVCVMSVDSTAWDQPVGAAWADLSPKACEGKPKVITPEEARRFCTSMHKQRVAKLLSEPRILTLSGQVASVLSGGQCKCTTSVNLVENGGQVVPVFETKFVPFGTQFKCLPVVQGDLLYLECDCELSMCPVAGKEYRITIATDGEEPRTETMQRPTFDIRKARFAATMPHTGQTFLMHCGRDLSQANPDAPQRDLMVLVTPHVIDPAPQPVAVMPPPSTIVPSFPPQSVIPTVWTAPMPMAMQIVPASAQEPMCEPKLAKLLDKYHQACAAGDTAKARKFAERCMAIDPTCFGK
jgi:hypothetical protein